HGSLPIHDGPGRAVRFGEVHIVARARARRTTHGGVGRVRRHRRGPDRCPDAADAATTTSRPRLPEPGRQPAPRVVGGRESACGGRVGRSAPWPRGGTRPTRTRRETTLPALRLKHAPLPTIW